MEKGCAVHKGLFVSDLKGVFHHGAIILLNTSFCQALSLRPDGSCSGAGQQQQESYWKVHKIGSGLRMFESVKKQSNNFKDTARELFSGGIEHFIFCGRLIASFH